MEFVAGPDIHIPKISAAPRPDHADIRKSRHVITQDIISAMKDGNKDIQGVTCGARSCVAIGHDERFHTNTAKKIMAQIPDSTYCGIFRSGAAVRVMIHSASGHSAIHLAGGMSEILGGRAAGDKSFAQGGGRDTARMQEAVSWIVSRIIP